MTTFALTVEGPSLGRVLSPRSRGAGQEVEGVERSLTHLWLEYYRESSAMTYREAAMAEQFQTLADKWREFTRFRSSLTEITDNPVYRAIIQLGDDVVPLLLRELQRQPEPWFAALREITGEDPVSPSQRGDMRAMTQSWLRWGRQRRLIR